MLQSPGPEQLAVPPLQATSQVEPSGQMTVQALPASQPTSQRPAPQVMLQVESASQSKLQSPPLHS
jgi:hypothetical protein